MGSGKCGGGERVRAMSGRQITSCRRWCGGRCRRGQPVRAHMVNGAGSKKAWRYVLKDGSSLVSVAASQMVRNSAQTLGQ